MHPDLEKLVEAGRLPVPAARRLAELEEGAYCRHKSWGVGRIAAWDLLGDRLMIDFVGKPGHPMKLEFAAKSLEPIPADHILARWMADPEGVSREAVESPEEIVADVLRCHGGSLMLDQFEEIVKGRIVPEGKFKSWWESTKKRLRADRRFVVPPKRTEPLVLRHEDLSPADAMVASVVEAKDLKAIVRAAEMVLSDLGAFENPGEQLAPVLAHLDEAVARAAKLHPAEAVDLVLVRDELARQVPELGGSVESGVGLAGVIQQAEAKLGELISGLPVTSLRKLLGALPDAFGDEWPERALEHFNRTNPRGVAEIGKYLVSTGASDRLGDFLGAGVRHRTLSADVVVWLCRERAGAASDLFDGELAACILQTLERDYYDEESSRNNRLHDLLLNDQKLVPDLMGVSDLNQAKSFTRRVMGSPVFEELNRRSLLMRVIKVHPEVESLVSGSGERDGGEKADERLVVSWESLEARKAAFEHLVKVEIPQNTKDIARAREYGDLRENFEFKSAKEQQRVLMRRQSEMERDLANARGTDFQNAPTHVVSIGTKVTVQDPTGGSTETYSVLGAWDSDPDGGIVSYLSAIGEALLGRSVGETVQLPAGDEDGSGREAKITQIEKYATTAG